MFGELEESDIYVNNQNESFEEPADSHVVDDEPVMVPQQPESDSKKIVMYILVLVLLLVCAGAFYFYKMNSEQSASPEAQNPQQMGDMLYDQAQNANPQAQTTPAEGTAVVDVDLSAPAQPQAAQEAPNALPNLQNPQAPAANTAKAGDVPPVIAAREKEKASMAKEQSKLAMNANKKIVVPVANGGRINPFVPFSQAISASNMPKFDIIAPPLDIPDEDPLNDSLMSTKISGIMYDSTRPSAIINFDGTDHLVHKGDKVKGYSVIDITRDKVVLKYGTNIYRAAVGQEVDANLNFNEVSDINRQFGGTYGRSKSIININAQ